MLAKSISGAAAAASPAYIEDVFSTYLYTGTGATQTITNNIDLSGKGGLVWIKGRSGATGHRLTDTARGATKSIESNSFAAEVTESTGLTAFNGTGFSIGADADYNTNTATYVSWTFRKQAKFFDVVTYTGNGTSQNIAHNLGSVPGCIMVKRVDDIANWCVYHRGSGSSPELQQMQLNETNAVATSGTAWNSTAPTSTQFSVGNFFNTNASGGTYVAYLFAHDAGGFGLTGTDNVISCGSLTGGSSVDLGWEPQWLLLRPTTNDDWTLVDNVREFTVSKGLRLLPNSTSAENSSAAIQDYINIRSNGFFINSAFSSATIIYIAIRRGPMKVPTSGTSVFSPTIYTGTNVDNRLVDTTIAPDMVWVRQRNDTVLGGMVVGDRLRGQPYLLTGTTAAEVNDADAFDEQVVSLTPFGNAFSAMNGFWCGNDATAKLNVNTTSNNHIAEAFRRAPGFFDVVAYTGTGATGQSISHSLATVPELIIIKRRSGTGQWFVYHHNADVNKNLWLNSSGAEFNNGGPAFSSITSTSIVFDITYVDSLNNNAATYVAYLFDTLTGVSKVGSYTGTGTTKQIDCGFTGGARFVLIKRTDSTGDWYVWDTARGIVAGDDPYLLLNSTAAEVTNTDYIDTYSAGFEISSTAPAAINANGGTFIFLAIA